MLRSRCRIKIFPESEPHISAGSCSIFSSAFEHKASLRQGEDCFLLQGSTHRVNSSQISYADCAMFRPNSFSGYHSCTHVTRGSVPFNVVSEPCIHESHLMKRLRFYRGCEAETEPHHVTILKRWLIGFILPDARMLHINIFNRLVESVL
jgi:hypothetical protein